MGLCGGFSAEVRAKKMRQDGSAEFISASLNEVHRILGSARKITSLNASMRPAILQYIYYIPRFVKSCDVFFFMLS